MLWTLSSLRRIHVVDMHTQKRVYIYVYIYIFFLSVPLTQKKKPKDSPLPVSPPPLCSPISDGSGPLSLGPLGRKTQPKAKAKTREVSGVMDQ